MKQEKEITEGFSFSFFSGGGHWTQDTGGITMLKLS